MDESERDTRTERVVIYMTKDDADYLSRLARDMKFRSRSTLIVAILERLIMGGFSIGTFFRVGSQIQKRAQETIPEQIEFSFEALRSAMRPLPALPPECDPSPREVREGLKEIREEILTVK